MSTLITSSIDRAIQDYQALHQGNKPLYCIMSAEEADELAEVVRSQRGDDGNDTIVTTYQDIKIIRNSLMERGKYVLSNELPETGS